MLAVAVEGRSALACLRALDSVSNTIRQGEAVRHHIQSEIEIEAPPETVWTHLTDLTSYADWNPFITAAEGTPAVGERLKLRMQPPGGRAMTMRPTVTAADPTRVFEWLGRLGMKG